MQSEHEHILREYSELASQYDRRWARYVTHTTAHVLDVALPEVSTGACVLDIGCGTGELLAQFAQERPDLRLCGLEPVGPMLEKARLRLPDTIRLEQAWAEALPFADNSVDMIVSSSAFHYFAEPESVLEECHRVLSTSGKLIINDWSKDYWLMRALEWYLRLRGKALHRVYRQRELSALLTQAHFSVVKHNHYRVGAWGMMLVVSQPMA